MNVFLDFFCKHNNRNKTGYVNAAVMEKLEKDMKETTVEISMADLFTFKNIKEDEDNGNGE